MRTERRYQLAFLLLGGFVVFAFARGVGQADERWQDAAYATDRAPQFFGGRAAFGHGDPSRAGIDPYAPPGMPRGVRIDKESGLMLGLERFAPKDAAWISWERLGASRYANGRDDVAEEILALDGQRVAMAGFLKAIYAADQMRSFLLVGSHLACCFGTFPGVGGVVETTLATGEAALDRMVVPILVTGRLEIRPSYDFYEGRRRVVLLFRMLDAQVTPLQRD